MTLTKERLASLRHVATRAREGLGAWPMMNPGELLALLDGYQPPPDPSRRGCHADGCTSTARHGPDGVAVACWSHAGDWPEVPAKALEKCGPCAGSGKRHSAFDTCSCEPECEGYGVCGGCDGTGLKL